MAFEFRYVNGFDICANFGPETLPYVASQNTFPEYFSAQYDFKPGYQGGLGFRIYNTGFREAQWHLPVGEVHPRVNFRAYIKPNNKPPETGVPRVLMLRFERGNNGILLSLRLTTTGALEIVQGGYGVNTHPTHPGTLVGTVPAGITLDVWTQLEVRADASAGKLYVWLDDTLAYTLTTSALGAGIDRVTIRWEYFGTRGMIWDHVLLAVDSETGANKIGPTIIQSYSVAADKLKASWLPATGTDHYAMLNDAKVHGRNPPDKATYVLGAGATGTDLYTIDPTSCIGRILGIAWNVAAIGVGADAELTAIVKPPGGTLGTKTLTFDHDATREFWQVQQALFQVNPHTELTWIDAQVKQSGWGFKGKTGAIKVSLAYVEKITSLRDDLSFECSDRGSYSY